MSIMKKSNKFTCIIVITATMLSIIYVILSLINIFNTNISTSIFHETYEKWKDSTYFTPLHPTQRADYIYSVMAVLPFITICVISIFSKKLKSFKKLKAAVPSFLLFMFFNYIGMDSANQSKCSDNWVKISLISELQNIFMILNIVAFLLVCCAAAIEMYAEKAHSET